MNENPVVQRAGIERRTVLKSAAWSVPVLAAAVAVPAHAAASGCAQYTVVNHLLQQSSKKQKTQQIQVFSNGVAINLTGASITATYTPANSLPSKPGVGPTNGVTSVNFTTSGFTAVGAAGTQAEISFKTNVEHANLSGAISVAIHGCTLTVPVAL